MLVPSDAAPTVSAHTVAPPARAARRSWGLRQAQFDSNLEAFAAAGGDASGVRQAWSEQRRRFALVIDDTGTEQVLTPLSADSFRWLTPPANHTEEAERAALPADIDQLMPGPYLLSGIGLGHYALRLWRRTRNTFLGYSSALYVVEPDLALLAVALHLLDWREFLADPTVFMFIGPGAIEAYSDRLSTDADLPSPRYVVDLRRSLALPQADAAHFAQALSAGCAALDQRRSDAAASSFAEVETRYQNATAAKLARRFRDALRGDAAPLRILCSVSSRTSFLQYSMRDAIQALGSLGCETRLLIEKRACEMVGAATWHNAIREFEPDMVLVLDHLRSSFAGRVPRGLPIMTWDQDALPHLINDSTLLAMHPTDLLVGIPHIAKLVRVGRDPRQALISQLATCPQQFNSEILPDAELAPYRCDMAYVSHASQTSAAFHATERSNCTNPGLVRLLDALYPLGIEYVECHGGPTEGALRELLRLAEQQAGLRIADAPLRDRILFWYLWRLCDRHFRHQALEWAARWARSAGKKLRIYGRGWSEHPTLAPFAVGEARNGHELRCVYQAASINLQLMPAGFLHQRALDGLSSGGFFLVRESPADRSDAREREVREFIRANAIASGADFIARSTEPLRAVFRDLGVRMGFDSDDFESIYHYHRTSDQVLRAANEFTDFESIAFSDESEFVKAANRYLNDAPERRRIADAMREVVRTRFSYERVIERFLNHARDYYESCAGETSSRG